MCSRWHHPTRRWHYMMNYSCYFNTDSNCFPGQMSGYYSPYASGFTAAQMAAAAAAAAAQQSSQVNKKKCIL